MSETRIRTHAVTDEAISRLRNRILQQTSHVIAKRGVDGCSLTLVAAAAGCSIGMIQHHFQTRNALVLASIAYRSERATDEWQRISETVTDPIRRIGDLLSFAVEGEESFADAWGFWVQAYAAAPRDPEVRDTIAVALQMWRSLFVTALRSARDTNRIASNLDPERLATYVVAAADGLAMQTLGGFYGGDSSTMRSTLNGLVAHLLGINEEALTESADAPGNSEAVPR
ncbi:TetR/AcrR family transcriptional regulator [Leucobacter coleopterorum]|uniref:TetR/AcrR family transcriptional regulator n=1 Tax=Leucobacter coleopterorum TaxID=2714933 RepID=A0ABX6JTD8_9MICO|nr:TetR/AcrR family transcriptional regulator [Leucobacter coleopterorum]QIM17563.1 TetR/AcrR family transcriptional regulator [Leucobacter coleopterorum]